jgi:hypothetical protein
MAALPLPKYGLEKLFLYPLYQTQDQYRRGTGEEPPAFDPTKSPKYWFDPEASKSTRRNIVYDLVIAYDQNGKALSDANGMPVFESMVLSKQEAATVNIPLAVAANEPGADKPQIPMPLREPDPDEEIFFDFGGAIAVRNKKLYADTQVTYSAQDREVLLAIARKLNVNL